MTEPSEGLPEQIMSEEEERQFQGILEQAGVDSETDGQSEMAVGDREPADDTPVEEESVEEVEAEPEEGEASEPKARKQEKGTAKEWVPLQKFLRTEKEAKAAAEQAAERDRELEQLRAEMEELKRQKSTPPPPDPNEDPEGHARYVAEQKEAEAARLKEENERLTKQRELDSYRSELVNKYTSSAREFASEHDDFQDAVIHSTVRRQAEMRARYPEWTDAQVREAVDTDDLIQIGRALDQGLDPAEFVYQRAIDIYGYGAKSATPAQKEGADRLAQLNKGKRAARSAAKGGPTNQEGLTLERLLKENDPQKFARGMDALIRDIEGTPGDII